MPWDCTERTRSSLRAAVPKCMWPLATLAKAMLLSRTLHTFVSAVSSTQGATNTDA